MQILVIYETFSIYEKMFKTLKQKKKKKVIKDKRK